MCITISVYSNTSLNDDDDCRIVSYISVELNTIWLKRIRKLERLMLAVLGNMLMVRELHCPPLSSLSLSLTHTHTHYSCLYIIVILSLLFVEISAKYVETSAKTGYNIDYLFMMIAEDYVNVTRNKAQANKGERRE